MITGTVIKADRRIVAIADVHHGLGAVNQPSEAEKEPGRDLFAVTFRHNGKRRPRQGDRGTLAGQPFAVRSVIVKGEFVRVLVQC